jgi:hypothetical protein
MGITKVIRASIVLIVALILFFTVFIHADILFKTLTIIAILVLYAWFHSEDLKKDTDFIPTWLMALHDFVFGLFIPPEKE